MRPQPGDSSPWGIIQDVYKVADGITTVCTARHGGDYVEPKLNATIPKHIKDGTFNQLGLQGWYEEDCDVVIPTIWFGVWDPNAEDLITTYLDHMSSRVKDCLRERFDEIRTHGPVVTR